MENLNKIIDELSFKKAESKKAIAALANYQDELNKYNGVTFNISIEALLYQLSQILKIDPNQIKVSLETGISFNGKYDRMEMLRKITNPTREMFEENNKVINSYEEKLCLCIELPNGLQYKADLPFNLSEICYDAPKEELGYYTDVKHTKIEDRIITTLIIGGKLNKYICKFSLKDLLKDKNNSNELEPIYIVKSIIDYQSKKEKFTPIKETTKRR